LLFGALKFSDFVALLLRVDSTDWN